MRRDFRPKPVPPLPLLPENPLPRYRVAAPLALLIFVLVLPALFAAPAAAQAAPSGYQDRPALWAGAEYAWMSACFPYGSSQHINGIGAFADYQWNTLLDLEGEARWMPWGGFAGSTESSYLGGVRHRFPRFHTVQPYAKFLIGEGRIHYPYDIGDAGYLALVPGGGINWSFSRRLALRVDYEYQFWHGSPGFDNQPSHALAPNGIQVGITYRVHVF